MRQRAHLLLTQSPGVSNEYVMRSVAGILFSLFQAALRPTAPTSSSRSSMTF